MHRFMTFALLSILAFSSAADADGPDPAQLVKEAIDYWRGQTSYTEIEMTIHRPDWERSMSLQNWTQGEKDSLVRFTAPAKDAGNALLKVGDAMWVFTPKLNQIMNLPISLMAQNWMGSDFSYNDLAKSDQLLRLYTHKLAGTAQEGKHTVYTVESIPNPDAAVVWGKEVLRIRDDHILLEEAFFDQDMKPVKRLRTLRIDMLGKKLYPVEMEMAVEGDSEQWTRLNYRKGHFDMDLPAFLFTEANLRTPRPWSAP